MNRTGLFLAVFALFLIAAPEAVSAKNEISYSGSSTIGMSILQAGAVKKFEQKTGLKFKSVENPGSGKGMKALIDGKVTIAGASRSLTSEEKRAKVLGHIIGYDAVAVFVSSDNPVKNLTKEQLKGIFTGKITNWEEVGGKNAPIKVNTEILGEKRATMLVFQELAMDNAPYASGFKEIDLPRDQIVDVAREANGICTVSLGLLDAVDPSLRTKVKAISVNGIEPNERNVKSGAYLISRPLILATMGLPKGSEKKFIDFMMSKDGQDIVARSFVRVRR